MVQSSLRSVDLWKSSSAQIEPLLSSGINLCTRWVETCARLTGLFWAHEPTHKWKGETHVPAYTDGFAQRLEEV